jgi:endonuclease YncB( thermonuclease family)
MLNFRLYKLYLSIFVLTGFLLVAGSKVVDNKNVSAVVTRVYDGDTFYIEVKDWPDIVGKNMPVRIYGIDCPELKSSDVTEHEYAQKAKFLVIAELAKTHNKVTLSNLRRDKYFRILCDISIDGNDLGQKLIQAKLARKYDGGHKEPWNFTKE